MVLYNPCINAALDVWKNLKIMFISNITLLASFMFTKDVKTRRQLFNWINNDAITYKVIVDNDNCKITQMGLIPTIVSIETTEE